jgi:hypothetical protein
LTAVVGDTVCFRVTFNAGQYADEVTGIKFQVNDGETPGRWDDPDDEGNWQYPRGSELFLVQPDINTIYFWIRDDFCEFGSTRRIWLRLQGVDSE